MYDESFQRCVRRRAILHWPGLGSTLALPTKCHNSSPNNSKSQISKISSDLITLVEIHCNKWVSFWSLFLWEVLWLCEKAKSAYIVHFVWRTLCWEDREAWPDVHLGLLHGYQAPREPRLVGAPPTSCLCLGYPLPPLSCPQVQILAQMPTVSSRKPFLTLSLTPNTKHTLSLGAHCLLFSALVGYFPMLES